MKNFIKNTIQNMAWFIVGFIFTILLPPFIFAGITYVIFPNIDYSFMQLSWIMCMIWLALNYITISIEKAIKNYMR